MPTATLTKKGQLVIPAAIRARYGLTPGTQVEFRDGVIRLLIRPRFVPSEPAAGYGMVKIAPPRAEEQSRRLSDFNPADTMKPNR